jgi:Fe-S oxidoreductase
VRRPSRRSCRSGSEEARRLAARVRHFSEFWQERALEAPHLARKALLWGHCHAKATGGFDPEPALLERMGLEVEIVRGGCCGLAGSWGFEADHYEVSLASHWRATGGCRSLRSPRRRVVRRGSGLWRSGLSPPATG